MQIKFILYEPEYLMLDTRDPMQFFKAIYAAHKVLTPTKIRSNILDYSFIQELKKIDIDINWIAGTEKNSYIDSSYGSLLMTNEMWLRLVIQLARYGGYKDAITLV